MVIIFIDVRHVFNVMLKGDKTFKKHKIFTLFINKQIKLTRSTKSAIFFVYLEITQNKCFIP